MSRADESDWETAIYALAIPLFPDRKVEPARASQHEEYLMETLTKEEKNSAAAAGMSEIEFARAKARLSASRNKAGLSREELAVARNAGMSPRAFASKLRGLKGSKSAIAAAEGEDKPGLLRAHQESAHPQGRAGTAGTLGIELVGAVRESRS